MPIGVYPLLSGQRALRFFAFVFISLRLRARAYIPHCFVFFAVTSVTALIKRRKTARQVVNERLKMSCLAVTQRGKEVLELSFC